MKKPTIAIFSFLLGAGLMITTPISAAVETVQATFAKFNFIVNGETKELEVDPLVYQGTTYLPVRVVANMLGYDVTYKADSRTIEFNNTVSNNTIHNNIQKGVDNLPNNEMTPATTEIEIQEEFDLLNLNPRIENIKLNEPTDYMKKNLPDVVAYASFTFKINVPQDFDIDNGSLLIIGDVDNNGGYHIRERVGKLGFNKIQHGENSYNFELMLTKNEFPEKIFFQIRDNKGNWILKKEWAIK